MDMKITVNKMKPMKLTAKNGNVIINIHDVMAYGIVVMEKMKLDVLIRFAMELLDIHVY
jgi:hypothetical protein